MIGIDEVGRGCLAGPLLVVAARQHGRMPVGLTDSKRLSPKRRRAILAPLQSACSFGEGWVAAAEIDTLGLSAATRLGAERALSNIGAGTSEKIIIDGSVNYAPLVYKNVICVVRADLNIPTVSAASVYAKLKRDAYMRGLAKLYPSFGFDRHVGYGTSLHLEELRINGPIDGHHRNSFSTLKRLTS